MTNQTVEITRGDNMGEQAFTGLRVLDCTQGFAGPYCTKLLADFGAEVIKVERPGEGDATRRMEPFLEDQPHPEKSGTFFYLNTSKKSITLDLKSETGVKIFKELVKEADVLIENLAPGIIPEPGLSYEILSEVNPQLIMTSISHFGQTGPYRHYKATSLTVYGLGGAMYTLRPFDKPLDIPVVEGGRQAEYITAMLSFVATVAALFSQAGTSRGTQIDISAIECIASILTAHTGEYSYIGLSRRTNPLAIHGYPIGYSYPCKDGWISLMPGIGGVPNIPFLIDRPELQDDPLFAKSSARMAEHEKFDAVILPWLKEHDKMEITREAQGLRLAFTPVLSPGELLDDEQLKAREFFARVNHPIMGEIVFPGAPAKLSETPWQAGRAPLLGEHNEEVYGRLGYTREELVILREEGVI
ncbi:CaiB/BaiF CoA transferase family protein [Chloroflexota bacterium]